MGGHELIIHMKIANFLVLLDLEQNSVECDLT